jgi:hypothetical protein
LTFNAKGNSFASSNKDQHLCGSAFDTCTKQEEYKTSCWLTAAFPGGCAEDRGAASGSSVDAHAA